nr:putative ribonuclease H-like domain-containing protein [Tanacetum cinerariifolium]
MNMGQDRQMQMVGGNGRNQFRQYAGQNAGNINVYNAIQNVRNQVAQNLRVQNVGNQNGQIDVQNQIGNGNLVAVRAEGNAAGHNGNQIRCYNCRGLGHFARDCTVKNCEDELLDKQIQLEKKIKELNNIMLKMDLSDDTTPSVARKFINEVKSTIVTLQRVVKQRIIGNKMHKAFPLLGESSHWQYKFPLPVEGIPTAKRMEIPLPGVCIAMMKKLPVQENWQSPVCWAEVGDVQLTGPELIHETMEMIWKSIIKRYIDTKPNHELIHYCLTNPLYELGWIDKEIPISEGSHITRTERFQETYKNVSQDIRDQLNAKAEAVQIILTGIDNDIYSTVDACPNACEMWKAIERLKHEWQRFVTLVKQNQELKTVSYYKLYDILKQHQHEVNEIKAKRISHVVNPLALVAQQQLVYHPQTHPTHYTHNSSTRSQQAATRNRGKAIVNSPQPIYDQEPFMKIYKPTNNNLRTSSNTSRANQDNSLRINRRAGYENQRTGNVARARETVGSTMVQKSRNQCYNCKEFRHVAMECQKAKRANDADYHREKMLLCKQEEAGIQLNVEQADWMDDTDDDNDLEDQELEAHYIEHPEQSESVHDTYPIDQDAHNVIIDSLDMSYNREEIDHNDDNNDLSNERELLASLIQKLKCEFNENKNRNKFLETSNKVLVEKLKGEIEDFKNKNKSLESSNNHFKEANNKLSETNNLLYTDYKKSEAKLARRNSMEYASQMEIECAKVKGDFLSYKIEYQKSCTKHTQTINDLNQTISEMKDKLFAHQETISILSQQKEAQIKLYKTREDKELEKVIALENKVKLVEIVLFIVDSGCLKHMTGNLKLLINFVEKFLGTIKFGNDQIAPILGYGDLVQEAVTIKRVYYVEGLNHNLFFVGQFCDANLEAAFRKSTCYICDLKGNDSGSHETDLYSITLQDTNCPNLICLMVKATSSQAWLWHRRLSHLNFDTINLLSKNDIVVGLLIYTWTHFLRSKDETPKVLIDFLRLVQRGLQAQVRIVRTDKGTEFLNQNLHAYFAAEGILHQTSVARTPKQNGVVERWNRTLVEAARTMLSAAKVPLFFWAEAIATACFTQNRSLVIPRHEKTPYHIINDRKP